LWLEILDVSKDRYAFFFKDQTLQGQLALRRGRVHYLVGSPSADKALTISKYIQHFGDQ
jgi:hypothetical protein